MFNKKIHTIEPDFLVVDLMQLELVGDLVDVVYQFFFPTT
jgi:hypothetical protein